MKGWRGVAGAVAGTAAASVAAGLAVERYAMSRIRGRLDPETVRTFHESSGRRLTVPADDQVPLHVEVDGNEDADLTIVFCHGWTLEHASWSYQRRQLADLGRLVFWDQCCHGRSGRRERDNLSIDALGDDLRAVIDETAPSGPLVLVGHSMGGMTIMALAEKYSRLFEQRVAAVALVSTAAGGLTELLPGAYGRVLRTLAPPLLDGLGRVSRPVEYFRGWTRMVSHLSTQRLAFGPNQVSPEVVAFMDGMVSATPVDVVADYYPAILAHDKRAALAAFHDVPTLIIVGSDDRLIPARAGRVISETLPDAEFIEVPRAGHMVMLEQPRLVSEALRALVGRARPVGVGADADRDVEDIA